VLNNSPAALQLFRTDPARFDLVLTDQTMPEMTGFHLAREILALRPSMPIILCSGFTDQVNRSQAIQFGIGAFLSKPISQIVLSQTIREVLEKGKKAAQPDK
jgi:YesN/AraC family two-component response regulator